MVNGHQTIHTFRRVLETLLQCLDLFSPYLFIYCHHLPVFYFKCIQLFYRIPMHTISSFNFLSIRLTLHECLYKQMLSHRMTEFILLA